MKSNKWYNWTGDADWDEYCAAALIIWTPILLVTLIFVGAACYNTFVRHI